MSGLYKRKMEKETENGKSTETRKVHITILFQIYFCTVKKGFAVSYLWIMSNWLIPKQTSDEESDVPQTKTCINLKISCNWRELISDQ